MSEQVETLSKDVPFWQRAQIEIGGRWQLFPNRNTTWKKWLFDPFFKVVWPGKRIKYTESPEGCWAGVFTVSSSYNSESRSAIATYFWLSGAICVLGFDIGAAILYRPEASR